MAAGILNKKEMAVLKQNKYVRKVTNKQIIYTDEFKEKFITEYTAGKQPTQIFKDAGFDPKILGGKRIERAAARWRDKGRGKFSNQEIQILEKNPYVDTVIAFKYVIYSESFKRRFMKEYREGKGPTQIFKDAGFDPVILGSKRIERAAARWRESYYEYS